MKLDEKNTQKSFQKNVRMEKWKINFIKNEGSRAFSTCSNVWADLKCVGTSRPFHLGFFNFVGTFVHAYQNVQNTYLAPLKA